MRRWKSIKISFCHFSGSTDENVSFKFQSFKIDWLRNRLSGQKFNVLYFKKISFQSDYHDLIGISADLVDALEETALGNMVS